MEHYLYIKRNEVLMPAAGWLNFDYIMLSERRLTKSPHIVLFHLYKISSIRKSIEIIKLISFRDWRDGEMKSEC